MRFKVLALVTTFSIIFLPFMVTAQAKNIQDTLNFLCKRWVIDSIDVKDINRKFAPPENIKDNYAEYKRDGSFEGQDFGTVLKGKWKFNLDNTKIINYDIDNSNLKGEIIFTIIELTEKSFAITSNPMSGGQVIMRYKPK